METIFGIILMVFGILQIILFFKLWGMTNDIKEIKNKYISDNNSMSIKKDNNEDKIIDYSSNSLVVDLKTEKQMRVGEQLENGKYKCYSNGVHIGDFASSEFMDFDKWVHDFSKKKNY